MSLPALPSTADGRSTAERVNVLVRDYNRTDYAIPIFGTDSGTPTAYAMTPVPGIVGYAVGQIFAFKAANANSGAGPTLNVNGRGAGAITWPDGGALAAGDIPANAMVEVQVASPAPAFHLLSVASSRRLVPPGVVLPFAGTSVPAGYLLCFGQAVSRTAYAALFAAIGTTYGVGNGSTTFNVPDLRGRVAAGRDDMGGSAANRLTGSGSGISSAMSSTDAPGRM